MAAIASPSIFLVVSLQLIFDDLLQDKNPDPIGRLTHCSITDCSAMDDEAGPSTDGQAFDSSSVQPVITLNEIQCPLCDFRWKTNETKKVKLEVIFRIILLMK